MIIYACTKQTLKRNTHIFGTQLRATQVGIRNILELKILS